MKNLAFNPRWPNFKSTLFTSWVITCHFLNHKGLWWLSDPDCYLSAQSSGAFLAGMVDGMWGRAEHSWTQASDSLKAALVKKKKKKIQLLKSVKNYV